MFIPTIPWSEKEPSCWRRASFSPTTLALSLGISHGNTSPVSTRRSRSGESRKSYHRTPICVITHCQLTVLSGNGGREPVAHFRGPSRPPLMFHRFKQNGGRPFAKLRSLCRRILTSPQHQLEGLSRFRHGHSLCPPLRSRALIQADTHRLFLYNDL